MPVIVYYIGGPLDGEHQSRESVNDTPGYSETILIEPISYLDPTGGDYLPSDNVQATYGYTAAITTSAFNFTQNPSTLPANGHIPANWGGAGQPAATLQMSPGGQATYTGSPGPPPVPPNEDEWTGHWIYTGTEWFWDPFLDIDIDGSYLFSYLSEGPVMH